MGGALFTSEGAIASLNAVTGGAFKTQLAKLSGENLPTGLPLLIVIPAIVASLCLVVLGARWHFQWRPARALVCTAAWMLVVGVVGVAWYDTSPSTRNPDREAGELIREVCGPEATVVCLRPLKGKPPVDMSTRLYAMRPLKAVDVDQIEALSEGGVVFVLAIDAQRLPDPGQRVATFVWRGVEVGIHRVPKRPDAVRRAGG